MAASSGRPWLGFAQALVGVPTGWAAAFAVPGSSAGTAQVAFRAITA